MPVPSARRQDRRRRDRARGQSLVEFALFLPVLLLIVLVTIDFGRAFVGWIGVNQMVRSGASYAATHPDQWPTGSTTNPAAYNLIYTSRATEANCALDPVPVPAFDEPRGVGQDVRASVSCRFRILAPLISSIVGGQVTIASDASFPIQFGCLAACPAPPPQSTPPPPPNNCRTIPDMKGLSVLGATHA